MLPRTTVSFSLPNVPSLPDSSLPKSFTHAVHRRLTWQISDKFTAQPETGFTNVNKMSDSRESVVRARGLTLTRNLHHGTATITRKSIACISTKLDVRRREDTNTRSFFSGRFGDSRKSSKFKKEKIFFDFEGGGDTYIKIHCVTWIYRCFKLEDIEARSSVFRHFKYYRRSSRLVICPLCIFPNSFEICNNPLRNTHLVELEIRIPKTRGC